MMPRSVEPLVDADRDVLLALDGECLLTDQDRVPSHVLQRLRDGRAPSAVHDAG